MKCIASGVLCCLFMIPFVAAQTCASGSWTINNQQPVSCLPYAEISPFNKPLPNAGNGGPLNNLYPNSDAIAAHTLTSGGWSTGYILFRTATPGYDDQGTPIYYGQASDPIYKVTCAKCSGTPEQGNPNNTYWHIPNQALFSATRRPSEVALAHGDGFINVWDQTNNKYLAAYIFAPSYDPVTKSGNGILPYCTAHTEAEACPISFPYVQMTDYTNGPAYQVKDSGGHSLFNGEAAMIVRQKEMMESNIPHALYLFSTCVNQTSRSVFPALNNNVWPCNALGSDHGVQDDEPNLRPVEGNLFFLDYTDAQIAAMNIPDWKKTLIRAMSHYGAYQGDTTADRFYNALTIGDVESGVAYERGGGARSPFYAWLQKQGFSCIPNSQGGSQCRYGDFLLSNIPNVNGPNCPSPSAPCGVTQHIHIAAECVAKGLAGLPGGCVDLAPPAKLRITKVTP